LVIQNFQDVFTCYLNNLHLNISTFPGEVSAIGSPPFEINFMIWWNRFHWISQLALPVLLIFSLKKIQKQSINFWKIILLSLMMYNIVLVSGISFGQGDRLILPAIPFLISIYAVLVKI